MGFLRVFLFRFATLLNIFIFKRCRNIFHDTSLLEISILLIYYIGTHSSGEHQKRSFVIPSTSLHFVYISLPLHHCCQLFVENCQLWTKKCQIFHKRGTTMSMETTNLVISKTCKAPGFLGTLNYITSVKNQFNKPLLQV